MAAHRRMGPLARDAKGELVFTDYSSAGNVWNETNRFRVWLPEMLDPSRNSRT